MENPVNIEYIQELLLSAAEREQALLSKVAILEKQLSGKEGGNEFLTVIPEEDSTPTITKKASSVFDDEDLSIGGGIDEDYGGDGLSAAERLNMFLESV